MCQGQVNKGLRQGCGMSSLLVIVHMNGVVRDVNAMVLELPRANDNQLLFSDDTALAADSDEKLCGLVSEHGRVLHAKE